MAPLGTFPLLSFVILPLGALRLLLRFRRRQRLRTATSLLVVPPQG